MNYQKIFEEIAQEVENVCEYINLKFRLAIRDYNIYTHFGEEAYGYEIMTKKILNFFSNGLKDYLKKYKFLEQFPFDTKILTGEELDEACHKRSCFLFLVSINLKELVNIIEKESGSCEFSDIVKNLANDIMNDPTLMFPERLPKYDI